ncbi:MAG: DUF4349 domain-containing protein [Halopenitus sp.]
MVHRNALATVLIALLLLTAGCSGVGDSGSGAAPQEGAAEGDYSGAAGGGAGEEQAESSDGASDTGSSDAASGDVKGATTDRAVIRTGEVDVVVDDYGTANDRVREIASSYDGFVTDSNRRTAERYNESWTRGHVTFRVPTEHFDEAFQDAQEVGTVRQASQNSKDVTDQLVDIEARLKNLRAERDRLRTLYEEANQTEDVLAVQRELSRVQEEIERLEARQRQLEDQVAYATITVTIAEEEPEPPEKEEPAAWYETGLLTAFLESTSGVATTLRALSVAFAYAAPYLLAFGAPVAGVVYVAKNRGKLPGAL